MKYSGVVEGFYGQPWKTSQRKNLVNQYLKLGGLNTYMYAPKYDLKHRQKWRELYSQDEIHSFTEISNKCIVNNINFIYSIAPGIDITYSSEPDFQHLVSKITQIIECGVNGIAILFDDIPEKMIQKDKPYYESVALAHTDLANKLYKKIDLEHWFFCPTIYCDSQSKGSLSNNNYLKTLAQSINPKFNLLWTGPEVVSTIIEKEHISELKSVINNPIVIWDNLFANDYNLRRCFMGPYSGREDIQDQVAGILLNPNCEFELNYIPLKTFSDFCRGKNKDTYEDALNEWYIQFKGSISIDELRLLIDSFYLPNCLGESAKDFIKLIKLKDYNKVLRDSWNIFQKLSNIKNRDLFHVLYRYAWELHYILKKIISTHTSENVSEYDRGSLEYLIQSRV